MKPIGLTKKQKKKLLEMCRIFWPWLQKKCLQHGRLYYDGATANEIEDLCGFHISGSGMLMCSYPNYYRDDSFHKHLIIPIHWFEFCSNYLIEDLAVCQFNRVTDDIIFEETKMKYFKAIGLNKEHPVDYLYKLYKSIPKGQ